MTSEARESSQDQGKPVMFFKFVRGTASWCYVSTDRFETYNDETYTPASIERSAIRQGSERGRQNIKVTLPSNLPVAGNWRPYSPSETIALTVMIRHVGETDVLVDWVGRIVSPKFGGDVLELTGEPSKTRGRRQGGDRRWQVGCDLVLYGKGVGLCNLDPEATPVPGVLTVVDVLDLTAPEFADASRSLLGGRLEWIDEFEETQFRTITAHDGELITIDSESTDLIEDLPVVAYLPPLYVEATLTAVSGLTLAAAEFTAYASGRLAGGYIKWTRTDGLVEYRTIRSHEGDQITLDYGGIDLALELVLIAYPGCAHTWADCGFYENRDNYGGNLHMPIKNPYGGDPVW